MLDVLVVGAGISGLIAARTLHESGYMVTVLDKGRGVGGRMATRRIANSAFDHGAQFFTVREVGFQKYVDKWLENGTAAKWADGFPRAEHWPPEEPVRTISHFDGHPRYRGVKGMNEIPKSLAQGIDIRLGGKVISIEQKSKMWGVIIESGEQLFGKGLILTPPVPQSMDLLNASYVRLPDPMSQALDSIEYDPCIAMLVLMQNPSRMPEPGAVQIKSGNIRWIADNHRKGIMQDAYGLTVHTAPDFSRKYWETDNKQIAEIILNELQPILDGPIIEWQIQKWRFSQPRLVLAERCLFVSDLPPLLFAGDAFGGPRVEGAALSGLAAADRLRDWFKRS